MYRPPSFREDRLPVLHRLIRDHPLALLVTHGTEGIAANLLPFTLTDGVGERGILRAHLARSNPQLGDLRAGDEALVIFQGPQAYVSPSWYPAKQEHGKVVPTWNYVMVQVRGRPTVIEDAGWLAAQIAELTDGQERQRPEPWSVEDAPPDFVAGQIRGIAGIEIPIDRIEGKWKASQNHPDANRAGVIAGLRADDPASPMALLMEALEAAR